MSECHADPYCGRRDVLKKLEHRNQELTEHTIKHEDWLNDLKERVNKLVDKKDQLAIFKELEGEALNKKLSREATEHKRTAQQAIKQSKKAVDQASRTKAKADALLQEWQASESIQTKMAELHELETAHAELTKKVKKQQKKLDRFEEELKRINNEGLDKQLQVKGLKEQISEHNKRVRTLTKIK